MSPPLVSFLETSAVITTILQFFTGALVCRKYIQKKSTGESSGFPFVCGFLSCSLWLRYGFLTDESIVVLVNIVGSTLMFLYIVTYYIFTVNKRHYVQQFAIAVLFLFLVILYTQYEAHQTAVDVVGYICCLVTVMFFGAPLTMLLHVIRVKNSESLPFPLILSSFIVSLEWVIYGVIINDPFIQIPNILGCILSTVQLWLCFWYPPKSFTGPSYKLVDQNPVF